eukprot:scaffold288980_cov17-Tisochrysis_lutea.AAC.2
MAEVGSLLALLRFLYHAEIFSENSNRRAHIATQPGYLARIQNKQKYSMISSKSATQTMDA